MVLSLRFAEEADFSSRAVGVDLQEEDECPLSEPIFRWSKSVRESLVSNAAVDVEKLVVAMPGGPEKFLQELTSEWVTVATLVVSDETIQPCKLQNAAISACVVLSKYDVDDKVNFGRVFAVRVPHAISQRASWVWVNALQKHISARETFCLDSQTSATIYDHAHSNEQYPLLRMLATSSVALGSGADADKEDYPVRTLEVPRFTSGIPAALITLGEVKKQRVRVLLTICEFTTVASEMVRCFLPLCSLLGLDRPLFFRPQGAEIAELDQEFNGLYT